MLAASTVSQSTMRAHTKNRFIRLARRFLAGTGVRPSIDSTSLSLTWLSAVDKMRRANCASSVPTQSRKVSVALSEANSRLTPSRRTRAATKSSLAFSSEAEWLA